MNMAFSRRSFVSKSRFEDLSAYEELLRELYRKRGQHYYHLPWSLYADLSSISTTQLMLFARSVKAHILNMLRDTYSEGNIKQGLNTGTH
jgi:uncharacterized protein (DUF488 family)